MVNLIEWLSRQGSRLHTLVFAFALELAYQRELASYAVVKAHNASWVAPEPPTRQDILDALARFA